MASRHRVWAVERRGSDAPPGGCLCTKRSWTGWLMLATPILVRIGDPWNRTGLLTDDASVSAEAVSQRRSGRRQGLGWGSVGSSRVSPSQRSSASNHWTWLKRDVCPDTLRHQFSLAAIRQMMFARPFIRNFHQPAGAGCSVGRGFDRGIANVNIGTSGRRLAEPRR
jgi:hypothetical protein